MRILITSVCLVVFVGIAGCKSVPASSRPTAAAASASLLSYDEAMQLPVEIGDATQYGGESQLSSQQVADEMNTHLDQMYNECIERELRRGSGLGTVSIDLVICGYDGSVRGATIDKGSRRFQRCMEGLLEEIHFPTFSGVRMGARYQFHID